MVKVWVRKAIVLGASVPFLPHVLELTYVQNTGAAFSFLAGSDLTWLLAIVSLIATMVIALALRKDFFPGPWGRLSLSLLLAGAAGNLIDRAALGYVTDMFKTVFRLPRLQCGRYLRGVRRRADDRLRPVFL